MTDLRSDISRLVGWIVGGGLVLYGLAIIYLATPAWRFWWLFSTWRSYLAEFQWLIPQLLFATAIVVLGVGIALRRPWTRHLVG